MVRPFTYHENAIFHSNIVREVLSLAANILKKNGLSVIDIGCGSGRVLLKDIMPSLPKNFVELVGVDKSQSMVDYCRTVNKDHRVSFEKLDITTKDLPKKYVKRFDLVTSFLCFNYIQDYSQTIKNIHTMLKPNGELVYIHPYKVNPLYDAYRELYTIDRWKPFLEDFKDYAAPFSESNRQVLLEEMYRCYDMKLLKYEFSPVTVRMIPMIFAKSLQALDTIGDSVPEHQREAFKRDLHETFCTVSGFDHNDKEYCENLQDLPYDFLTVHARKPV